MEKKLNDPFLLQPIGKDYIWGGRRLKDDFGKNIDLEPLAETWECSTHSDGLSIVKNGEDKGLTLKDVLIKHPEYVGTHPRMNGEGDLPILVKFIDAKNDLSVQVHPTDEYACKYENGQRGKTEMWYVIDASKDAKLVYGFNRDIQKEELKKSMEDGTVEKYLQKVKVSKNDVFFIESGTVHAIGSGCLIAEIQESSNLTYRLFDYNRIDKTGKKRELHLEKSLDVANLAASSSPRQPMRVMKFKEGYALELLCRCKYFQVERMLLNTERIRKMAEVKTFSNSFEIYLCVDGCGSMMWEDKVEPFFKGDCIFMPANSKKVLLHGKAKLLKISC